MMRSLLISLLLFLFNQQILVSQIDDREIPVARIGTDEITRGEFIQRFELTPWPGKHRKGFLDVIKEEFLYAMIAERLLALEAKERGYLDDSGVQEMVDRIKRWYAKDYLYKEEVRDALDVTEIQLRNELIRSKTTLYVSFLFFESPFEADIVWRKIREGTNFDSIVLDNPEHMIRNHQVEWRVTHPHLIAVLDTLDIGEVSPPVPTEYGFYIVKLEDGFVDPIITEAEFERQRESLEKQLRSRLERPLAKEFVGDVVGSSHIQIHGNGLRLLIKEFERVLEQKRAIDLSEHPIIIFYDLDFDEMIFALKDQLETPLLTYGDIHWDLGTTLRKLRLFGVWLQRDPMVPVTSQVRNIIEDLVIDEVLSQKAIRRNYHELPKIRREIEMWRSHFIAELLKRDEMRDIEIDEYELYQYYENNREEFVHPLEVNIREILVDTRTEANNIVVQLDSGREFAELARLHSKRRWAAEQGGEFGYFPSTLYGEIGRIAATLEPGERFGPLQVPEGYSIFELIDKREPQEDLNQPFEDVRESIASRLIWDKQRDVMNRLIADIADKYPVQIDYDALHETEVTDIQMFGFRYFGFGGRYPAVPMLDQQTGWIYEFIRDQMIYP